MQGGGCLLTTHEKLRLVPTACPRAGPPKCTFWADQHKWY